MRAAVAAGHPATVEAGIEVLADGGSAADAAVAASLASCVAETVMTGLLGGGHAIHYEAATGARAESRLLRRGARASAPSRAARPSCSSSRCRSARARPLRGRDRLVRRARAAGGPRRAARRARAAAVGAPGRARAAARARRRRLPARARRLPGDARAGDDDERGRARSTRRAASSCRPAGGCSSRGWCGRSSCWPTRGRGARTTARWPPRCSTLMDERGGLVTRDDLDGLRGCVVGAGRGSVLGHARADARRARAARRLPGGATRSFAASRPERGRSRWRARSTGPTRTGDTTNLVTVDEEGNACVLTSSLGLGSGDWLPGLDLHLNSMLGEADLIREPLEPGRADGQHDGADARARRRRARTRRRRGRRHAAAQRARPGAGGDARRGPLATGGDRPAAAAPGRRASSTWSRASRTRCAPALEAAGYAVRAWPDAAPLLRRRQRRHADRCGG